MKTEMQTLTLIASLTLTTALTTAAPLGTAFTYEGKLAVGTNAANGNYDLKCTLFDAASGGNAVGGSITNSAVGVANGLFVTAVDFGANAFTGSARWLEIAVRTNGGGAFTTLSPRQPLMPTPYALYASNANSALSAAVAGAASSVSWSGLTGVPAGFADGIDNDTTYSAGVGLTLAGTVFSANFGGTGSSSTVARSDHQHDATYWKLSGNGNTTPGTQFLGTSDNQPLEFKVNGERALRLEPQATSPNVIGGFNGNAVDSGIFGGTIAGGGSIGQSNRIIGNYGTVGGGWNNLAGVSAAVSGGSDNTASSASSAVSGGTANKATNVFASVGGGLQNVAGGGNTTVAGGFQNMAIGSYDSIGGGYRNSASGGSATIAGGQNNTASLGSAISGGNSNQATGLWASIPGGDHNQAAGAYSFAAGRRAQALHPGAFVWADSIDGDFPSTSSNQFLVRAIGGVGINTIVPAAMLDVGFGDALVRGPGNFAARGTDARVSLGDGNNYIRAVRGEGLRLGAFEAPDALAVNNGGNVGIGTTSPASKLDVAGTVRATSFSGSGVGLTGVAQLAANQTFTGMVMFSPPSGPPFYVGSATVVSGLNADFLDGWHGSHYWQLGGNSGVGPGDFLGTTENQPLEFKVNSQRALRLEPNTSGAPNVIGGSENNFVGPGVVGATIGGGGQASSFEYTNAVLGNFGVIGGGAANTIESLAYWATIAGGGGNTIQFNASYATIAGGGINTIQSNAYNATVGGGWRNTVQSNAHNATISGGEYNMISTNAWYASIGGGRSNTIVAGGSCTIPACEAGGKYATVPGGSGNVAMGDYSFAAGQSAYAEWNGEFVWADSQPFKFRPWIDVQAGGVEDSFSVRAVGGIWFVTGIDGTGQATAGVHVNHGSSSWSTGSDRNLKDNFAKVDGREILARLAAIPIQTWNYKAQSPAIRHIGPMAQDFAAAFAVGEDDKHISTVDADGVALAAIQGLNQKLEEHTKVLEGELKRRDAENAELRQELGELKKLVGSLANKLNGGVK